MKIIDYIPVGHKNAVTRKQLVILTGLSDRKIRNMIQEECNREHPILNMQDGKGYFQPAYVMDYCQEKGYTDVDVERFMNYYTSNGWMVGKNKMKDWKAAMRNWARKDMAAKPNNTNGNRFCNFEQRNYDYDALEKNLLWKGSG